MDSYLPARLAMRRDRSKRAVRSIAGAALVAAVVVLVLDSSAAFVDDTTHRLLSSAPLIAIAIAYLWLQMVAMPGRRELLERALLGLAFLLWALSQLIDPSRLATIANDGAILLFVFDLGLIIRDQIEAAPETQGDQEERPVAEIPRCACGRTCCCEAA